MDTKVNYAGITRRVIAGVIDNIIILGITPTLFFVLIAIFAMVFDSNELSKGDSIEMAFNFFESKELLFLSIYTMFFVILEILMIIRFNGTPGQLLYGIHIKDAKTLKSATIMQVVIRCTFREIVDTISYSTGYISICFAVLLVLITFAIFDKRKQFFHDKIAKVVAIDYKSSS
ncbi:MAG TPA: transporter [Wolbachia sp.]|jgi:uncharacterized RDD family membrane protein YckC|uniref:RDD family protein n=1 Tax=Wolbachia endosymbiont of Pentalonia nigronervosa TaxID=1301914 RepID=UPI000EDE711D|nr:RDD family protein [Wolbachia endosymbiont of Pentalonia nigronervosa]MBD0391638.1 RDD family protein [Wolbachia endosymbiont of Pentalonia nigronervosa]HCE59379.1 transporter [Wolbachia sp.]